MASGGEFRCVGERLDDGTAIVTASGELDIVGADPLRRLLAELRLQGDIAHLVVDLSGVPFIDSSGMGVLVGAQRLTGPRLRIVATHDAVWRALHLARLDKVFVITQSRAEALESLLSGRGATPATGGAEAG
jgi:anti-sigma B factor antagonist